MSKLLAALRQIDAQPSPTVEPPPAAPGGSEPANRPIAETQQAQANDEQAISPLDSAASTAIEQLSGEGALRTVAELNHLLEEALAAQQIDLAGEPSAPPEVDRRRESLVTAPTPRDHLEGVAVSREFADMADRLLAALITPLPAVAMFATTEPDTDDSFWLLPLAIACARSHVGRVLIVEADRDVPRWPAHLGIETDLERGDALESHAAWRDRICRTAVPRVELLSCAPHIGSNDEEANEQLDALLIGAKTEYQMILVAAGNAHRPAAAALARHCDGVVLVVGLEATARSAAHRAKQALESAGARVVGVIVRS